MNQQYQKLLEKAYDAFNTRDIDTVLSLMDASVHWPNGWEGGYVQGHEEVRDYWTRQWKEINPSVYPVAFNERTDGTIEVEVDQLVKDLQGNVLVEGRVKHVYCFQNGKVKSMEIEKE